MGFFDASGSTRPPPIPRRAPVRGGRDNSRIEPGVNPPGEQMNESNFDGGLARPAPRYERLTELLEQGAGRPLRDALSELHPAEAAAWFESLPARHRDAAWSCIDPARRHDVLAEIEDAVRAGRLLTMRPEELAALAAHLDEDDVVDILQELPDEVMEDVLEAMEAEDRARLSRALAYPEDSAGGLMNRDAISVRADMTVEVGPALPSTARRHPPRHQPADGRGPRRATAGNDPARRPSHPGCERTGRSLPAGRRRPPSPPISPRARCRSSSSGATTSPPRSWTPAGGCWGASRWMTSWTSSATRRSGRSCRWPASTRRTISSDPSARPPGAVSYGSGPTSRPPSSPPG